MTIGISGSHGSGKSTLAQAFAEKNGLLYVPNCATVVYESLGLSPKVDYDFGTRLHIQREILLAFDAQYGAHPGVNFVTDRTPLDLMAYTLADVQRENLTHLQAADTMRYWEECLACLNKRFGVLFILQPGIPVREREGKAPSNRAYIEHISRLVIGLVLDSRINAIKRVIATEKTDLSARVEILEYECANLTKHVMDARESNKKEKWDAHNWAVH